MSPARGTPRQPITVNLPPKTSTAVATASIVDMDKVIRIRLALAHGHVDLVLGSDLQTKTELLAKRLLGPTR
jgi:hypothetical protein